MAQNWPKNNKFWNSLNTRPKMVNAWNKCLPHHFGGCFARFLESVLRFGRSKCHFLALENGFFCQECPFSSFAVFLVLCDFGFLVLCDSLLFSFRILAHWPPFTPKAAISANLRNIPSILLPGVPQYKLKLQTTNMFEFSPPATPWKLLGHWSDKMLTQRTPTLSLKPKWMLNRHTYIYINNYMHQLCH